MSFAVRMAFYVQKTDDGLVHVQNFVMGLRGQHHMHTPKGFQNWKHGISGEDIVVSEGGACGCGLKPGDVRDHDGAVWHKADFE